MRSWEPWYVRWGLRELAPLAGLFALLLGLGAVAVLLCRQEHEREVRCEARGGVWVTAYKTQGRCLAVEGGRLVEIAP
jgi:hypothetical protein